MNLQTYLFNGLKRNFIQSRTWLEYFDIKTYIHIHTQTQIQCLLFVRTIFPVLLIRCFSRSLTLYLWHWFLFHFSATLDAPDIYISILASFLDRCLFTLSPKRFGSPFHFFFSLFFFFFIFSFFDVFLNLFFLCFFPTRFSHYIHTVFIELCN